MARRNSTLGRSVLDLDIDDSRFHSKLSGAARAAGRFTEQSGSSLMKAGRAISGVGNAMVTNVTVPILAAGGAVAHFALDFDTTMRRIVGLAKVPQDAIAGVREEIVAMGQDIGRSPQELAEAFYFVASAGFEADEAMEVLRISATAAAAGMGQTQDIAKTLGGVINAYGKENLSAARAGDILTAAIQDGAAEASDFAGVIGFVVPVAASLGVSFDQVTAALAAMTQVGISADTAATNLGQVMAALQKPTKEAEEALEGLGLSSAGLRRQLREEGLLATLRTLETAFAGNADASAIVFGNIRALRGVTALLGLDTEQLNGIFADTAGALDTLSGAYSDTEGAQRDIDRNLAKLQASAIELGTDVLPMVVEVLGDVADAVSGVAGWWKTLDKSTKDLIISSLAWLAIAGPVLVIVGKLTTGLGALLKVVGVLVGAKGIPALATQAARAKLMMFGLAGVVAAITIGMMAAGDAAADFFDELQYGRKAAKVLKELEALLGNEKAAKLFFKSGHTVADAMDLIEAAGGDAGEAIDALNDTAGDLGKALVQLGLDSEDSARAMFGGWGPRGPVAMAAIEAGRSAKAIPENVAAELVDGEFVIRDAAEDALAPIDEALQKAVEDAAKAGTDMIHALATSLSADPTELADAAEEMWEIILHPFPDIKRRAQIEAILTSKLIADGLSSDDSRVRAETAERVEKLLAEYELMAPGALAAGELVNPALEAGINSNLDALLTYIRTIPATNIADEFDLADVLESQGNTALAGYIRGIAQGALNEKTSRALDAVRATVLTGLTFYLGPAGYTIGSTWIRGIISGIHSGMTDLEYQIALAGDGLGHSLPTRGPLKGDAAERGGLSIGTAWMGAIGSAIEASVRALDSRVAAVGDALAIVPQIGVPTMPGVASVGMASQATATSVGIREGGGDTFIWQLSVNGVPYTFETRDDFIGALDDLSGFGDGRLQ
jgi:TP901 family phage tail tape measure protein